MTPIDEKAKQLDTLNSTLEKLRETRKLSVYWFAQRGMKLADNKLSELNEKLSELQQQLEILDEEKERLKEEEQDLAVAIKNDNVGQQISMLSKEILSLEKLKNKRQKNWDDYNKKAVEVGFGENPSEDVFDNNREKAREEINICQIDMDAKNEDLRLAKNESDSIIEQLAENTRTLETLLKNKNNITGREAEIREMILQTTGATPAEIPFIGELIRVKDVEKDWENSIEKILHNFALRLIVPDR